MYRKHCLRFIILLIFAIISSALQSGQAKATDNEKAFALIIGIDDYTGGWPSLKNAVNDARAIAEALPSLGYEVDLRTNVTSQELHRLLLEFFVIKGADPEARLLLWYAGHGETIDGEGYLVPSDAPISAKPQFLLAATPVRMLGSYVRLAQARHVLAVFDSCFAGTVFESRGAPAAQTIARMNEPVREFLTSGDAGQRVRDDGSFREYFLRGITGAAEANFNNDAFVTGAELGLYLSQKITELTGSSQTPQYGKLHDIRFNRGDFAFEVARSQDEPNIAPSQDILFWDSIKWSSYPEEYEAYLRTFPKGLFAGLAAERLKRIIHNETDPADFVPGVWSLDQPMIVDGEASVNLRSRPNQEAPLLERITPTTEVTVTGKTTDGQWYRVLLGNGRSGYLLSTYLATIDSKKKFPKATSDHMLQATFGPPINETVTIPFDLSQHEIRHTAYLRTGAIAWFDGDIYANEMALSIFVDSPSTYGVAPSFRHVFDTSVPNSQKLNNLTSDGWWGKDNDYLTLAVQVSLTPR